MAGSITEEDRKFLEEWESISHQGWGITRLDPRGYELQEVVAGRKNFRITTEERILTQDKIKDERNDPFLNGSFRPIVVPDSVTIESNPNALSDDEIHRILATESDIAWTEWIRTLDAVATLRRMLDLAEGSDISIKRFRQLENRLEEVRGEVRIDTNDPALKNFLSDRPNLGATNNTTNSGAANPRRQGGRSSNYR